MTFVASNEVPVRRTKRGYLSFTTTSDIELGTLNGVTVEQESALREFFQHERDEELGRWRHPDYPDFYARRVSKGEVGVWSEKTNQYRIVCEPMEQYTYNTAERQVARLFLEAHPEPKPWHEAKPGEIWVVAIKGVIAAPEPYRVIDGMLRPVSNPDRFWVAPDSPEITNARRIWPEES